MPKNVKINITISEDLDHKLRETVAKTIGFKKGNLQIAIEEALEMWINEKLGANQSGKQRK